MEHPESSHEQCRTLADRLIAEYGGAVPPGQVLAAVFRVNRALVGQPGLSATARMDICESSTRRLLSDRDHLGPHRHIGAVQLHVSCALGQQPASRAYSLVAGEDDAVPRVRQLVCKVVNDAPPGGHP